MNSPMTPNTQSVCTESPTKQHTFIEEECSYCGTPKPVAEPASTGEEMAETLSRIAVQPSTECHFGAARPSEPSAPQDARKCWKCEAGLPHEWQFCEPAPQSNAIIGKGYVELEQMIENAAPQTSAEPLSYEQEVHALLWAAASNTENLLQYLQVQAATEKGEAKKLTHKCIEWKKEDLRRIRDLIPKALTVRDGSAAPQPVSGDAPKVEEIARKIANSIIRPLLHAANDGKKISLNFLDEVALETEAILRPYFPQTPQPPTVDELAAVMAYQHQSHTPDSRKKLWDEETGPWKEQWRRTAQIVIEKFFSRATPASTAAEIVDHLIWALEIMQMYERRLIQFGDPPVLVYSNVHKKRVAEALRSIQDAAKYVEFRVPNIETRNPKE